MKNKAIAIIGGSGVYQMDTVEVLEEFTQETPFGNPSDCISKILLDGTECYFLPRHGKHHSFLPHEVNYAANIFALKSLGVEIVLSVSAVGSLSEDCPPETFVIPDQYIDWTKGLRRRTFFGNGMVAHVSVADPTSPELSQLIYDSCQKCNVQTSLGGAYVCIEGPQFSSRAESHMYRGMGAKIIGMTNVPEAYLAREAGMAYATIAMVTDFDCWKEEHCTIEEILKVMKKNTMSVQSVLKDVMPKIAASNIEINKENKMSLMTPSESLSKENKSITDVLFQ